MSPINLAEHPNEVMKTMKKWIALAITLIMVMMVELPAMAATITITGGAGQATYQAYRIFDVSYSSSTEKAYAYTVRDDTRAIVASALSITMPDDWESQTQDQKTTFDADLIFAMEELDDGGIRTFADTVYKAILDDSTINATATRTATTSGTATFDELDAGYYLIAETTPGNGQDAYSLTMLATAADETKEIHTKESYPTLTKKVQEKNDSAALAQNNGTYQSAADYDIRDAISFHLTGTLPENYDNYESYTYTFTDIFSEGLTYNSNAKVYSVNSNYTNGIEISEHFTTNFDDETRTLTISCENLKSITSITKDKLIMVDYTATLNENAKIGSEGNVNTATLTYSRNPYGDETGTSKEAKTTVYTYSLTVYKTEKAENKPLSGAGFTLYKYTEGENTTSGYTEIKKLDPADDLTTFTFKGLDAGKYRLVESTVPAGYHGTNPIEFEITATYAATTTDQSLTSVVTNNTAITPESGKIGELITTVVNSTGSLLPETGGIGTTVFIVIGSIMVIGAIVLLITRHRVDKE